MTDELRDAGLGNAALAVWTTTPWTMPANLAVAVNDRMDYSLVQARPARRKRGGQAGTSFQTPLCRHDL